MDQKKSFSLGQKVFGFEETEWRKYKRLLAHSEKYGVFDEEQLISQLLVTDFQVESKGTLFRMSGVGCVATAPAFRGRGTVRRLFEQTLPDLANAAVPLSFLAPFSYAFYEKFGYRQIFSKQVISIKRHQLKPANNLFQSERCTFAAGLSVMCSIYDALRSLSDFSIVREKWWWEYSFDRKEYYYNVIKNKENNPIGYVIYQRKHEELLIKDLMMIELEGLSSILHELFNQNEHSKQIVFRMPKDHIDFNYCLKEPLQKQELIPHMMGRIISFSDFIQKYSFEPSRIEQRFFLCVEDEQVEKNHGVWELIIESGKTTKIVSTCDYDSDKVITASIGIWSQIFLGYSTIVELAKYGEVCGNKKIIAQLNKSIPAKHVRLFDFF